MARCRAPTWRCTANLTIPGLEITASGGIAAMAELAELQAMHCHAAILGKSIYTGAIDLAKAVRLYEGSERMITKRIIPCLDVKMGALVKGVNFEGSAGHGRPGRNGAVL